MKVKIKTKEQMLASGWKESTDRLLPPETSGVHVAFTTSMWYLFGTEINLNPSKHDDILGRHEGWLITEAMTVKEEPVWLPNNPCSEVVLEDKHGRSWNVVVPVVDNDQEPAAVPDVGSDLIDVITEERDFLKRMLSFVLEERIGLSAETVIRANLGIPIDPNRFYYPRDNGDFMRVSELLAAFPEMNLDLLSDQPGWRTFIPHWNRLKLLRADGSNSERNRAIAALIEIDRLFGDAEKK